MSVEIGKRAIAHVDCEVLGGLGGVRKWRAGFGDPQADKTPSLTIK